MIRTVLAAALLLFASSAHADLLDGWRKAKTVLDQGLAAMGGADAIRAKKQVSMSFSGTEWRVGQSLDPEKALDAVKTEGRIYLDTEKQKGLFEGSQRYLPDYTFRSRTLFDGANGWLLNIPWQTVAPMQNVPQQFRATLRGRPHNLLLFASERANTLRYLGNDNGFDAIVFADTDGSQNTLYFDANHVLRKVVTFFGDPIRGDILAETTYPEYRAVDGVQMPVRMVRRENGLVVRDLAFTDVKFNTPLTDAELKVPEGWRAPAGGEAKTTQISEGVWMLEFPDPTVMFVEADGGVYIIEGATNDSAFAQGVIDRVRAAVPGKEIKGVVLTHWHHDHSGGVRAYVAAGIPIITTPLNVKWLQRAAEEGARTVAPDALARAPREPIVQTFEGRKRIGSMELIEMTKTPHVDSMVVAWFPKEQVLFQSDMVIVPRERDITMSEKLTRWFAAELKRLNLEPQRIVGYHGRVVSRDELTRLGEAPGA
ncbi:MAG TPA: MBL fold metallo-hydrolase [Thermoanaerobaculia bacterium]|jgi:glyoxylase-like metal-dependent hydrolase (beta-lactamase superfamily II)